MNDDAVTYDICVEGHLGDHWADWLGGVAVTRVVDGTTHLTARVADQAQLHGVLSGLRDLNACLRSVRVAGPPPDPALPRPLRTRRLLLRPATSADADPTWAFRRLPSVSEWLSGCPGTAEGYRDLFADPERLAATVVVELGDRVVGDLVLRRGDGWGQREVAGSAAGAVAELCWVLDPAHRGRGYATEAVRELIRYCFEDLGVRRVTASCFADDQTSWRLMERVGMRRETHAVRESLHRSGRWLDTVGYALLAEEWPSGR